MSLLNSPDPAVRAAVVQQDLGNVLHPIVQHKALETVYQLASVTCFVVALPPRSGVCSKGSMLDGIDWRNPVRTWRPEVAG